MDEVTKPKLAYWDTEWSPAISYTWSGFPKFLPLNMHLEDPRLLCFGFKFEGESTEVVDERIGREAMLYSLWEKLNETDLLVSYNGQSFDTPKVNSEFMKLGLAPPSPYKEIDLYRQIKRNAKFYSGKLDFIAGRLVGERKEDTGGFQLWKDVLAGDEAAWGLMRKYQAQDVDLLEKLLEELRPWIKMPFPISEDPDTCHNCGSADLQKRGLARTQYSVYQRLCCNECGKWSRALVRQSATNIRPAM